MPWFDLGAPPRPILECIPRRRAMEAFEHLAAERLSNLGTEFEHGEEEGTEDRVSSAGGTEGVRVRVRVVLVVDRVPLRLDREVTLVADLLGRRSVSTENEERRTRRTSAVWTSTNAPCHTANNAGAGA